MIDEVTPTETALPAFDWETTIRGAFKASVASENVYAKALATTALAQPRLNEFCYVIAPKLAQAYVESEDPAISALEIRLWSCPKPSHVSVVAIEKSRNRAYVVDAAGLLNATPPNDSDLGVTILTSDSHHPLYGRADIAQFISPPITKDTAWLRTPATETEMGSVPFSSLSQLFTKT